MPRIEKPSRTSHLPDTPEQRDDVAGSPGGRAVASSGRQVAGSPAGPIKRFVVRRGFDYYEDQLATLKKLSLREQMAGRDGSMSRMVREALDEYLAKHTPDSDPQ